MPILPSGRRRASECAPDLATGLHSEHLRGLSKEAASTSASSSAPCNFDALRAAVSNPEKQSVPSLQKIAQALDHQSISSDFGDPIPGQELPEEDLQSHQDDLLSEEESDFEASLESYFTKKLVSLGVSPRTFKGKDGLDPFFQWDEDLDSGTSSGFYLIPTYTIKGEISRKQAKNIASEMGKKFNLSQKLSTEGNNYKVKFQTRSEEPQRPSHGSSFDELLSPTHSSDGDAGFSKSALSKHQIINSFSDRTIEFLKHRLSDNARGDSK